jgi:hypothetical protein
MSPFGMAFRFCYWADEIRHSMKEHDLNTNTLEVAAQTAEQKVSSSAAQKITLALLWAAVAAPLVWGVLKAWDEVRLMF